MRSLLLALGLPDLSLQSLLIFLTVIVLVVMALGWLSDLILGDGAFGVAMNTGLIAAGAIAGAWLWQRYGVPTRFNPVVVRTGVATGSGLLLLLGAAVFRR
jgi:multisubunit Na+/H+ antiporter MnhB subunit